MIRRFFTENLALKLLSLAIALLLWLLVVNVSKPEIMDSRTVTLEVRNQQAFEANSKTWEVDRSSVTVSYRVRSDVSGHIRDKDFVAYVNLEDYSITGSVPVYVEASEDVSGLIDDITVRPTVVKVNIENIQEKKFPIETIAIGEARQGYNVSAITVSPENIFVTGPESEIGRISKVGIEVNVADQTSSFDGVATPVFYDANNNHIKLQDVQLSSDEISYTVSMHKEKSINLLSSVTGSPMAGYQYESTTVSPDSVLLSAAGSVIDRMTVLELPAINIANATTSLTVTFDISKYLPAGVELADPEKNEVNVTVRIEKLPETEAPASSESSDISSNGPVTETSEESESETPESHGNTAVPSSSSPELQSDSPPESSHAAARTIERSQQGKTNAD